MDTPDRNQTQKQIGTPISKFEDSPVFNYINSLSPIKPVKSIHFTQTFNPLSFASLPSIFTSPHLSSHKGSRFLRRHQSSEASKPELASENGNKPHANDVESGHLYEGSVEPHDNFDPAVSIGEPSAETPNQHSKFVIELPRTLKYESGSPVCNRTQHSGTETGSVSELSGTATTLVPLVHEASEEGAVAQLPSREESEITGCDWESLISDAADLLIFSSPGDSDALKDLLQKSMESGTSFSTSLLPHCTQDDIHGVERTEIVDSGGSREGQEQPGDCFPQPGADYEQTQDSLSGSDMKELVANDPSQSIDNEPVSHLHRGVRRRCLDFEMVGSSKRNVEDETKCSSSVLSQSDEKFSSNNNQLIPVKPVTDPPSRCALPGIGLHLNALAASAKDHGHVKHGVFLPARRLLNQPNTVSSSSMMGQESLDSGTVPSERGIDVAENGQLAEDSAQPSTCLASEELNSSSPKKKRRKLDQAAEGEACKRCNCKKSKCLKLYCECFAAGVYCIEPCSCQDCFNKPIHEDTVLATRKQIESRNPLAFTPKVIRGSDFVSESGDDSNKTPASARHKRGCNCKKSSCLKKYCECYQGGVGCSVNCRCEGCKNAFGRKDGPSLTGTEAESEETDLCEKSGGEKTIGATECQEREEQNPVSVIPATPLQISRHLTQLPFISKSKPPRSSYVTIGSCSALYTSQRLGKPNVHPPPAKFENQLQTVPEDEVPEILQSNSSPSSTVKTTTSPNSKRVSPPNCHFGSSPARRSGRKLILQSIPSFPSLTHS